MKKLIIATALAATIASPAFAAPQSGGTARASAVRECSGVAAPYREPTWGNFEIYLYRSCMSQRGQVE
jgi:hypothetical protein